MKKNTAKRSGGEVGFTAGLDVGDKYCYLAILDSSGELIEESRVSTSKKALSTLFSKGATRLTVVIEAGTHSRWIARLIEECGHQVIIANPRRLRLIYDSNSKGDRTDAQLLARVGRLDQKLLFPIKHRGEEAHADLTIIRSRDVLVKSRTQLVNHVRGIAKGFGVRLKKCSTPSFHRRVRESVDDLPQALKPAVTPLLDILEQLTKEIARFDRVVERIAKERYPETERLKQVTGVGALTSLAYVLTIEDPHRFSNSRTLGPFLGLTSRKDQSGDRNPQLRITKSGDGMLRRLMVGSAHYVLGPFGPDSDLRRTGFKLASRGGKNAKKRAVVAVARKLSVVLHRLWITGEEYEPLRNARKVARRTERISEHQLMKAS